MKRLAALLVLVVAGASACGSSTEAFSVNGQSVDRDELAELVDNWAAIRSDLAGEEDGAVASSSTSFAINAAIRQRLFLDEVAEQGIEVTDAHRQQAREQLAGVAGLEPDTDFYDFAVEFEAAQIALGPTDDEIQQWYDDNQDLIARQHCTAHILVETEAEAEAVLDRLEAGEDFGAVAQDVSTDPGSAAQGGEYGCQIEGSFVPEYETAAFEAAEAGETLTDPVESDFGFHVIRVDSAGRPPVEQIADQIAEVLQQSGSRAAELELASLEDEDVTVDARYGTWDAETDQLLPPG